MGRRRDAALATLVLCATLATAVWVGAPRSPTAVLAGAAGAVGLELLLSVRTERVRAVWARPGVQVASVVAFVGGAALGVSLAGGWVLTALAAGLATYLLVLGVVTAADHATRDG